jgi:N utilization substance protein A
MMDVDSLTVTLDMVAKEKDISREVLVQAIESAIETAAQRVFGGERELEAVFNPEIGQVELFQYMAVVDDVVEASKEITLPQARQVDPDSEDGDELGFQIFYLDADVDRAEEEDKKYGDILGIKQARQSFGRIAAQTAKQVIIQRVREAERAKIFEEYKDRQGELVTGIARRFERGHVIVDLGRAEGILPSREQMHRESYRAGDRVQAYVKEIRSEARGPQIILSRTDAGLIFKLFEMEVPEIYEGIVRIVAVAREPGERTKIAVASRDSDVDPVGACVGMKGSRVQAVVQELRGEKVDIVPWTDETAKFVCNAIAPADVSRVLIDEKNETIELIVPDDQLSLAIGRRGQNVRLASQLVGWRIDITSETKVDELKDELRFFLREHVSEFAQDDVEYMFKLGFHSAENIINADAVELTAIPGIEEEFAMKIQDACEDLLEARETQKLWPSQGREAAMRVWWGGEAEEPAAEPEPEVADESEVDEAALLDLNVEFVAAPAELAPAESVAEVADEVADEDDDDDDDDEDLVDPGPVEASAAAHAASVLAANLAESAAAGKDETVVELAPVETDADVDLDENATGDGESTGGSQ